MNYIVDKDGKWTTRKGKKYELIEPSQEYLDSKKPTAEQRVNEIKRRLEELDNTVPRIVEDLIAHTGFTPFQIKQDILDEKKALREEIKGLGGK